MSEQYIDSECAHFAYLLESHERFCAYNDLPITTDVAFDEEAQP